MLKLMFCYLSYLLTFTLSTQNSLMPILSNSGIMLLDDKNFTQVTGISVPQSNYKNGQISNHKITITKENTDYLLLFYYSKCGHCVKFVNEIYSKITQRLNMLNFEVIPAALQCVTNPIICHQFKVASYPTLYYFTKEGEMFQYPNKIERSLENVVVFIQESHQSRQMSISNKNLKANTPIQNKQESSQNSQKLLLKEQQSHKPQSTINNMQHPEFQSSHENQQTTLYYAVFVITIIWLTLKLIYHSSDKIFGSPRTQTFQPFQIQHTQIHCILEDSPQIQISPSSQNLQQKEQVTVQHREVEYRSSSSVDQNEKEAVMKDQNETIACTLKSIGIEQIVDEDILQQMDDSFED